jgi:hypothetical protein
MTVIVDLKPFQIFTTPTLEMFAGTAYGQQVLVTGELAPVVWSASGVPPGMTLSRDGFLSGIPHSLGTSEMRVTATDAAGRTDQRTIEMVIRSFGPVPGGMTAQTIRAGTEYDTQITVRDGTPPYRFSVFSGALPEGIRLDDRTGVLSGVPTVPGSYSGKIRVADSDNLAGYVEWALEVVRVPSIRGPAASIAGLVGAAVGYRPAVTCPADPCRYEMAFGSLPNGVTLDASSGSISGIPTQPGTFVVLLRATDAAGRDATAPVTLTIAPPLAISTSEVPNAITGVAYQELIAGDGGAPPYAWAITAGALPAGLRLNSGGSITGVPGDSGSSLFSVTVTDRDGRSFIRELSLRTDPVGIPYRTLPSGIAGRPYTCTLRAAGGQGPYTWSADTLPDGLTVSASGLVEGTVAEPGLYTLLLRVSDRDGLSGTDSVTHQIHERERIAPL